MGAKMNEVKYAKQKAENYLQILHFSQKIIRFLHNIF